VFFAEHFFNVNENVFEPAEDSFLFAENLVVRDGDRTLDMGTGCGILGIIAAVQASEVLAVDINPVAVQCAKENARLNHVADRMHFLQGDLFAPIIAGDQFDLILFNAPYLPSEEPEGNAWLERAWAGGVSGRRVIDNFIFQAPKFLRPDGRILLMQSTLSDVERTLECFEETGLSVDCVARKNLPLFETIVLVKATLRNRNSVGY
jgi:release factor glutamine methyltransferase